MLTLKVLSRLLDYPDDVLWESRDELQAMLTGPAPQLAARIPQWFSRPLMDLQEEWGGLFERGRATSLLLFEHVHGESRDRGQAMVDLLSQYAKAGLALDKRELPDYLPLYLEYLSTRPQGDAVQGLLNVAPILALIGGRLTQRESDYGLIFDALLTLAGSPLRSTSVKTQVSGEARDDTRQALDAVWEEEQVKFIDDNASACESAPQQQYQRRFSQNVTTQYLDLDAK